MRAAAAFFVPPWPLCAQVRGGELPVRVPFVLGNHEASPHLAGTLAEQQIRYIHCPAPHAAAMRAEEVRTGTVRPDSGEAAIRSALAAPGNETDFLVLARYMRVLSGDFLQWYEATGESRSNSIVNIHHGLLPSFKGASPYAQAHRAGVKLIGATVAVAQALRVLGEGGGTTLRFSRQGVLSEDGR